MVSEITNNDDVTMPASSVSCQLNKNDELESSTVRPLPWNPSISVTKNGVVNIIGNNIENHYVIKKTAVTVGTNQNPETCTSTVAEKWRNFVFGDRRKKIYTAVFITTCLLIGAVVMTAVLTSSVHHEMKAGRKEFSGSHWYENASFEYVTRAAWRAITPKDADDEFLKENKSELVIASHTAGNVCLTREQCILTIQTIQDMHMSIGWGDIAYNFLIGGDGRVYEGRGWAKVGTHTLRYNRCSIGLSFIGNFVVDRPTNVQVSSALELLALGEQNGFLLKNFKVLCHNELIETMSPGAELIAIIKKWDHWAKLKTKGRYFGYCI